MEVHEGCQDHRAHFQDRLLLHLFRRSHCVPDPLDRPGRTMLTSEGTKNRSSHAITDPKTGKLRILLPEECERMNGFPTGWTDTGMPKRQRYFIMGNALVVPLITQMGKQLLDIL